MTDEPTFLASQEAVTCELGGGLAILDLVSDRYFSLNEVGAFVWGLLADRAHSAGELSNEVAQAFDIDKAACAGDVASLLSDLSGAGLIRAVHVEAA